MRFALAIEGTFDLERDDDRAFQTWLNDRNVKWTCPACDALRWVSPGQFTVQQGPRDVCHPHKRVNRQYTTVQRACEACGHIQAFAFAIVFPKQPEDPRDPTERVPPPDPERV